MKDFKVIFCKKEKLSEAVISRAHFNGPIGVVKLLYKVIKGVCGVVSLLHKILRALVQLSGYNHQVYRHSKVVILRPCNVIAPSEVSVRDACLYRCYTALITEGRETS